MPSLRPVRGFRTRLLLLALLVAPAAAQTFGRDWFPHPTNWYTAGSPACGFNCPSLYPLTPGVTFGVAGSSKAQLLIPAADLPNVPSLLQDIAFAPLLNNGAFGIYHYDALIVTMAQTPAATLSTTFAANLVNNPQVVMARADHYWTPNGHANGGRWPAALGIDAPYVFDPALGNLVIDIEARGAAQLVGTGFYGFLRATTQTVAAYNWSGATPPATGTAQAAGLAVLLLRDAASFEEFGRPCPTSTGSMPFLYDETFGQPILGGNQRFDLVNGVPNGAALMIGGFSLPSLDIAFLGAPGCVLHPSLDVVEAVGLDASGGFQRVVPIPPAPALLGLRVWFQFALFDPPANALGIVTSSYVRLLLGSS